MNLTPILQKIERIINVYFSTMPGNYRKKKLEILDRLFVMSNDFLKNTGAVYWIDFGTLLGHYRDGGIMPHDIDVDFGSHEDEFEKIWSQRNKVPKGITIFDTSHKHNGPKLYFNYKGFDADVYFYLDEDDILTSCENSKYPSDNTPYGKALALPVKSTTFLNQETFKPAQPKKYLEHIYNYLGPDGRRDKITGYWHKK